MVSEMSMDLIVLMIKQARKPRSNAGSKVQLTTHLFTHRGKCRATSVAKKDQYLYLIVFYLAINTQNYFRELQCLNFEGHNYDLEEPSSKH